jgi:mannan endo-1,4-beta-mannosidase
MKLGWVKWLAISALLLGACRSGGSGAVDATVSEDAAMGEDAPAGNDAATTEDAAVLEDAQMGADAQTEPDAAAGMDAAPDAGPRPAYYVDGAKLRDPCGAQVILRGVNKMAVYADRSGNSFPEIAMSGANTVRFMWNTTVAASEAVQTLQRAVDSKLIPIWEMHDATGDFSRMPAIEHYWTDPATVMVLHQFESKALVNIANEAGATVADMDYVTTYSRIVSELRNAGVRMPFIIDAAGYGRDVEQLLRLAPSLTSADPLHNLIFSWHEYDSVPDQHSRIMTAFQTAATQATPLIIGEFGNVTPGFCQGQIPYQFLITQAQAFGLGYLPWSWDNFNSDCSGMGTPSPFDMVADGIHFATLKAGWATEVVVSDPASIQHTSQRTPWLQNGACQ